MRAAGAEGCGARDAVALLRTKGPVRKSQPPLCRPQIGAYLLARGSSLFTDGSPSCALARQVNLSRSSAAVV